MQATHLAGGAEEAAVSLPGQALQLVPMHVQSCGKEAGSGAGSGRAPPVDKAGAIALPPARPWGNDLVFLKGE